MNLRPEFEPQLFRRVGKSLKPHRQPLMQKGQANCLRTVRTSGLLGPQEALRR